MRFFIAKKLLWHDQIVLDSEQEKSIWKFSFWIFLRPQNSIVHKLSNTLGKMLVFVDFRPNTASENNSKVIPYLFNNFSNMYSAFEAFWCRYFHFFLYVSGRNNRISEGFVQFLTLGFVAGEVCEYGRQR
jgi:hypothetical protein